MCRNKNWDQRIGAGSRLWSIVARMFASSAGRQVDSRLGELACPATKKSITDRGLIEEEVIGAIRVGDVPKLNIAAHGQVRTPSLSLMALGAITRQVTLAAVNHRRKTYEQYGYAEHDRKRPCCFEHGQAPQAYLG